MLTENPAVRPILRMGSLIAFIFVAGIGLGYYTFLGWRALNVMLGLVFIVSFFGVLLLPGGWLQGKGFTEGRVRFALDLLPGLTQSVREVGARISGLVVRPATEWGIPP